MPHFTIFFVLCLFFFLLNFSLSFVYFMFVIVYCVSLCERKCVIVIFIWISLLKHFQFTSIGGFTKSEIKSGEIFTIIYIAIVSVFFSFYDISNRIVNFFFEFGFFFAYFFFFVCIFEHLISNLNRKHTGDRKYHMKICNLQNYFVFSFDEIITADLIIVCFLFTPIYK